MIKWPVIIFCTISSPSWAGTNYIVTGHLHDFLVLVNKKESPQIYKKFCNGRGVSALPNVTFQPNRNKNNHRTLDWDKKTNYYVEYAGTSACTIWQPIENKNG